MPNESPLSSAEEGVSFDIRGPSSCSKSAVLVLDEELSNQRFTETRSMLAVEHDELEANLLGNLRRSRVLGERNIISQNIRKSGIAVLALERSCAKQHLINQYAEGPPIHCTGVSTSFNYLRGNVLLRANK